MTLQEAETSGAEILQKAIAGEETIIKLDGKPIVKVSPFEPVKDWFGMDDNLSQKRKDVKTPSASS